LNFSGTPSSSDSGTSGGGSGRIGVDVDNPTSKKKCDPDGFKSGVSLQVYEIIYDVCEANTVEVSAYSTCGPISVQIATKYGVKFAGFSSDNPFDSEQKRLFYTAELDPELDSFNVVVKDKRDSFSEKIYMNQCKGTKEFFRTTGYTSEQQGSFGIDKTNVPDWIKNNAGWWADGLITEDDFVKGIQYLVEQGIIRV